MRPFLGFSLSATAAKGSAGLQLDVAVESERRVAEDLLQHPLLLYAHFVFPCRPAEGQRSVFGDAVCRCKSPLCDDDCHGHNAKLIYYSGWLCSAWDFTSGALDGPLLVQRALRHG